jgi:hypothetical protein
MFIQPGSKERIMKDQAFVRFALALAACAAASVGEATVVTFPDFSSTAGLTLNGTTAAVTTSDGHVLRLTSAGPSQSGSAFSSTTINAASFSTAFSFRITDPGGSCCDLSNETGADGLTFVVQSVANNIGGGGGGIGYQGIGQSAAVEFDTWHNPFDPDSNHVGVDTNGNVTSLATQHVSPNFDDGNIWFAWIDYDGGLLSIRANQTGVRPASALLSQSLDIPALLGGNTAYVGFTSGTGADWGNHDILSWEYRDSFEPIGGVPEPGTLGLLGAGIGALVARRRRLAGRG